MDLGLWGPRTCEVTWEIQQIRAEWQQTDPTTPSPFGNYQEVTYRRALGLWLCPQWEEQFFQLSIKTTQNSKLIYPDSLDNPLFSSNLCKRLLYIFAKGWHEWKESVQLSSLWLWGPHSEQTGSSPLLWDTFPGPPGHKEESSHASLCNQSQHFGYSSVSSASLGMDEGQGIVFSTSAYPELIKVPGI